MAGALSGAPAGATLKDTAGALVGLRRSLAGHAAAGVGDGAGAPLPRAGPRRPARSWLAWSGSRTRAGRSTCSPRWCSAGWSAGSWGRSWSAAPGSACGPSGSRCCRSPRGRLAAGLLAASFRGFAPLATLAAFAVLPLAAARSGVAATLVAVPAMLLELVLVVVLSRVVVAGLAATLSSRRGQELGGLLMAVIIALASGGWSLATVLGQQLATGPAPALSTTLRVLPSGWAGGGGGRRPLRLAGRAGGATPGGACCCWRC